MDDARFIRIYEGSVAIEVASLLNYIVGWNLVELFGSLLELVPDKDVDHGEM